MKISHKIFFLILFLLSILCAYSYFGINQLRVIGDELNDVANKDIQLLEIVGSIREFELEKMLYFERISRIAEELEFDETIPARRKHLVDHANLIQEGFSQKAQEGGGQIIRARELLKGGLRHNQDESYSQMLSELTRLVSELEAAHIRYDTLLASIIEFINAGNYQLTINDLSQVQQKGRQLTKQIDKLITQIEEFTKKSLDNAAKNQEQAERLMVISSVLAVILSLLGVFLLIKQIVTPLKNLETAAQKIGDGDFQVKLDEKSKDEIGEVSRAFNMMSKKLNEAKKLLEEKNKELAENLEVTRQQKEDLEKVNKELDNFAHTVSHDIRSPLMGIIGYGSILENQYGDKLDERGKKSLEGVRQGVERLDAMIDDLLSLTRISRVKNPYEEVDFDALLNTVVGRLEYRLQENKVELIVQDNLPKLVCDRIKMGEVFLNLISNAMKFSSKSKDGAPRVEVGFEEKGENGTFFVKDNGIGIDPENQKKVFEIFKRIDTEGEYEGTGAGLAIVKTIIDDHGGSIWIESELGKGATFYFTIPKNLSS